MQNAPSQPVLSRSLATHSKHYAQENVANARFKTLDDLIRPRHNSLEPVDALTHDTQRDEQQDFYGLENLFTIEDLVNARVHLGHKISQMNPHMRPYIYGKRIDVTIFDLEKTAQLLKYSLNVLAEIAFRKGIILMVNSNRQTNHIVEAAARECGEYAHCRKWSDAVLTQASATFGSVTRLPDLIVVYNTVIMPGEMNRVVNISARMLIPTVGICDTNCDPTLVTYPVPGNDDSPQSIELFSRLFKTAINKGKAKRMEIIEKQGEKAYEHMLDEEDALR